MIDFIKSFFDIKKGSLFLVFTAYLAFNFKTIFFEGSFTVTNIILLILSVFFIEVVFKIFISKNQRISIMIMVNIFFLLFGYLIILFLQKEIIYYTDLHVRGRIIFILLIFILNFIFFIISKRINLKVINIFLLILSSFSIYNNIFIIEKSITHQSMNNLYNTFKTKEKDKSILLIITDEYHSPDDLFRVFKDSSVYDFSNKLKNSGWQINNKFLTNETSTKRSLSSLFNFNLSENKVFKDLPNENLNKLFLKNSLSDSLIRKEIEIYNYGIFDFGNKMPNFVDFEIEKSFFDRLIRFTTIRIAQGNTDNFKIGGFKINFFPKSNHNQQVFNNLKILNNKISKKEFIYSHYYMPHSPFIYEPEFKFKKTNTKNYVKFWKFTNKILERSLKNLVIEGNIKVIITGDHGYRFETKLNPKYTFLALYGFNETNINEVKTVQDLGSLINSNF
jgi:hypothetical protein